MNLPINLVISCSGQLQTHDRN